MPIAAAYDALKQAAKDNMGGGGTREALEQIVDVSLAYTEDAERVPLQSKVPGKSYGMLVHNGRSSRPVNTALYRRNLEAADIFETIFGPPHDPVHLDQCLYTAAMSFPLACDLLGAGNQKSPGTFFEIFVAHIFACKFGVNPQTYIDVPTLGAPLRIPTDFIFELGPNRRVHLPVKTSTRERVVQVWAHQKMLDGMLGAGLFRGILVCLAETNKQKDVSVVEVCLPGQWAAYQMYISSMSRIYYLDPPLKYLALRDTYPHIQVWPLSRFLQEAESIPQPNWV